MGFLHVSPDGSLGGPQEFRKCSLRAPWGGPQENHRISCSAENLPRGNKTIGFPYVFAEGSLAGPRENHRIPLRFR